VVGQIAKIKGCRAVGIAGGPDRCRFVVEELSFDACVDHRAGDFVRQLEAACPAGIDVYFENVGGAVQQTVWPLLDDFARVPVCGLISQYSATTPMLGPDMFSVLRKRLTCAASSSGISLPGRQISSAIWANGWAAAASSIARTWSRAWRTRLPRSLVCSKARTSASCW
jgi:NADPH:quinone reductase-like Zn-dependent oxidoreductase